ncbi:MAG: molybdopterin-dependent oxidoreductase, partial [Immundisolibacterales bacterium]|nr:molybdopterin-dependent oxidoreductase [Immundisolibacterales bacterium]
MKVGASLAAHPRVEDWITVRPDGFVEVRTGKVDIGQGIGTAIALVAARELGVPFDRISMSPPRTGVSPDEGYTSGSNSMEHSGEAVRVAAATARRELVRRAAKRLGVEPATLNVHDGLVHSRETNRTLRFGELVEGDPLALPVDPDAMLRSDRAPVAVAPPIEPLRLRETVTGSLRFLHDLELPDLLHARVVRPPHYHGRLAALPEGLAARLDGARLVRDGSFLAVAHADEHRAIRAAARVAAAARWSSTEGLDERPIGDQLLGNRRESFPVREGRPCEEPVPGPPPDDAHTVRAAYERPYQMHASLAPSAALARFDGTVLTVWTHSQGIYPMRAGIAEVLGLDPESVEVVHAPGAGCYGHNGSDDAALEAALVARAVPDRPVLLKWSREDEHAWEPYGPAMRMELRADLDGDGNVRYWSHDTYSDTHVMRPRPAASQPRSDREGVLPRSHDTYSDTHVMRPPPRTSQPRSDREGVLPRSHDTYSDTHVMRPPPRTS